MCTDSVREVVIGANRNFHTLFGNKIPPAQNLILSDFGCDFISLLPENRYTY